MPTSAFQKLYTENLGEANIAFAFIPYDLGLPLSHRGCALGPKAITDLSNDMTNYTLNMYKLDSLKVYKYPLVEGRTLEDIYSKTRDMFDTNIVKFIFGGDHSISIPLEQRFYEKCELQNKIPVVIHLDGLCNLSDFYDGSFTSHHCALRRAIGRGLKDENVCLIGPRIFYEEDVKFLEKHPKVNLYKVTDLSGSQIDEVVEKICSAYSGDKYSIYISFDIGVLDIPYAPGVAYPAPNGLKPKQVIKLLENFISRLNVQVMDIVDLCPNRDTNNISAIETYTSLIEIMYQYQQKIVKEKKK